jgi:hypothetical protein
MFGLRERGSPTHKGCDRPPDRTSNPLFLALTLLLCLYLLGCRQRGEQTAGSFPLDDKFPLAESGARIPFEIKSRNSLDSPIHSVTYKVKPLEPFSKFQMSAVAQKIVKETLQHEMCHRIAIDFLGLGYADFAPFGNWVKAGEVPIGNYEAYTFKYTLLEE